MITEQYIYTMIIYIILSTIIVFLLFKIFAIQEYYKDADSTIQYLRKDNELLEKISLHHRELLFHLLNELIAIHSDLEEYEKARYYSNIILDNISSFEPFLNKESPNIKFKK